MKEAWLFGIAAQLPGIRFDAKSAATQCNIRLNRRNEIQGDFYEMDTGLNAPAQQVGLSMQKSPHLPLLH